MSKIAGNYPTPIQGVSTLSEETMMPGYCKEQVNMRSDPVLKLRRRPPLVWDSRVMTYTGNVYKHSVIRDGKRHVIFIRDDGVVKGFIDGVAKNSSGDLVGYLPTDLSDLRTVTINDITFVVNTQKIVAMDAEVAQDVQRATHVNIISALNYSESVKLNLPETSQSVTYTVPALGVSEPNYDAADAARATTAVATGLAAQLNVLAGITARAKGSAIVIQATSGDWVRVEVDAGQGAKSVVAINKTIDDTDGLPLFALPNTVVTVKPDPSKEKGVYYLNATPLDNTLGVLIVQEVVWTETTNPEEPYKFDASTMPQAIWFDGDWVRIGEPPLGWDEREAGDNNTVKLPKFVGKTIKGLGYSQKRLIVLTGDNGVSTKTDDIYDFWRASAVALLVTDPFTVNSNATDVEEIKFMLPHDKDMLFIASNAQFKLDGDVAMAPNTAAMALTTRLDVVTTAEPVSMGNSVFIPISYGTSAGIIEYHGEKSVQRDVGKPITEHVVGYIQGTILQMVGNSNLEMLIVRTSDSSNVLFVYEQYTNVEGVKEQRSWSKWVFPETTNIVDITMEANNLSILSREGDDYIQKDVQIFSRVATEADNAVYLDNLLELQSDTGDTVVLPDGYIFDASLNVIRGAGAIYPLFAAAYTYDANTRTLTFDDNISGGGQCTVLIGEDTSGWYVPNRPFRRDKNGEAYIGENPIVGKIEVFSSKSYNIKMSTVADLYPTDEHVFSSEVVGSSLVGVKTPLSRTDTYAVRKKAGMFDIKIETDGYLAMTITHIKWVGRYTSNTLFM